MIVVVLNKCLKQVKLPISVHTCAPISDVPCHIGTMRKTLCYNTLPDSGITTTKGQGSLNRKGTKTERETESDRDRYRVRDRDRQI